MLLTRGMNGFGAAPLLIDPSSVKQGPSSFVPGEQLGPWFFPMDTRMNLHVAASAYRAWVTKRAGEIQRSLSNAVTDCIAGRATIDPKIQEACNNFLSAERLRMPIGMLDMLGVMFPVNQLQAVGEEGKLEQTYQPDGEQKFVAGLQAWGWSQYDLAKWAGVDDQISGSVENWAAGVDGKGNPVDPKHSVLAAASRIHGGIDALINGQATVQITTPAGNQYILIPKGLFVLSSSVPGLPFKSIEPTNDEHQDVDGVYQFYQRGGYLMSTRRVTGVDPIFWDSLRFNVAYFKCSNGKLAVWTEKLPDEGHGWLAYVTFGSPSYKIRVQMKDRTTWESVKKGIGDVLRKAYEYMCKAAPLAQGAAQIAAAAKECNKVITGTPTAAEKRAAGCTDAEIVSTTGSLFDSCLAKLRACKEGEPGCNCTTPKIQSKEQLAVAAGAQFLQSVCNLPSKPEPMISCDQLQPPPTSKWWWWALAGIGAVGGGIYFATRK